MSLIDITVTSLRSVQTRRYILGESAIRRVIGNPTPDTEGGVLGRVFSILGMGARFVGWLLRGAFGLGAFTFRSAWGLITGTIRFIYNFNWNVTDQELDNQVKNLQILVASQLGGTLGNALGWTACGILPATALVTFNEGLGLYILKEVGEEAFDELRGELGALIRVASNAAIRVIIGQWFKAGRRVVREFYKNPGSPQNQFVKRLFGADFEKFLRGWGTAQNKPFSFRRFVEDKIDGIKNPILQNFVEEFYEEFLDACVEAGYVIAGGLDDWVLKQKQQKLGILGTQRVIELLPDRESEESIIISAPEELAKVQIVEHMALDAVVGARDLGFFVGEPLRNNQRKVKSPITLRIMCFDRQTPPWMSNREEAVRASITIPGIERSKLDWLRIKEAVGGKNGYLWGRFFALAQLIDDQDNFAGSMKIYSGSKEEAVDRLKSLLTLSDYKIAGLTTHEEEREGARQTNPRLRKETTRVYPGHMTIINSQKIINQDQGRATLTGTYKKRRDKIPLWTETKPDDFEARISELLRNL